MGKALILVIAAGLLLGLVLPGPPVAGPPPAVPARAVPASPPKKPATVRSPASALETRTARHSDGHFYVDARVNGQPVRFLVDTGASAVALTLADARRVGASFAPAEFETVGTGASGPVRGQPIRLDRVELDGKEVKEVRGAVVEGLQISLLGQTFLSRMELVQMSGDEMLIR